MKKIVFLLLVVFLEVSFSFSQSADAVTEMINTRNTTYGQSAYFVATALELISETATQDEAITALVNAAIINQPANVQKPIPLNEFSSLCMKAWKIKGGVFYSLFKSKRYAFRELKALGMISISADPSQTIKGRDALKVITQCIDLTSPVIPETTDSEQTTLDNVEGDAK